MNGRPVRVPVDHALHPVGFHFLHHLIRGDVHDELFLALVLGHADFPQLARHLLTFRQRPLENHLLPLRVAHVGAELLVFHVGGAQAVAVHKQSGRAVQIHHGRIVEQGGADSAAVFVADQEIPVPVHQEQFCTGIADCPQGLRYLFL